MTRPDELLAQSDAVAFSWHGVLFDAGRKSIHEAIRETFARWGVVLSDEELHASRGPTGRPQIERLLSLPRPAEAFRAHQRRWPRIEDIDAMQRDLEPRLLEAARRVPEPNAAACDAIRRLHARGIRTAVVACTPRRLLAPQLEALERAGLPLDLVVTADEACEPAPAPWGLFEVVRQLQVAVATKLVLVDDCPDGALAARNAGARSIALTDGRAPARNADAQISDLSELR
jgi:beta-phosphoglucomutase-like phosphatase (HAD superfamily)